MRFWRRWPGYSFGPRYRPRLDVDRQLVNVLVALALMFTVGGSFGLVLFAGLFLWRRFHSGAT